MGVETLVAIMIAFAGACGGFFEGRRRGAVSTASIAHNTVSMLEAQVEALLRDKTTNDVMIASLRQRVECLESLVTQKAEVAEVKAVVDRIATKVGA